MTQKCIRLLIAFAMLIAIKLPLSAQNDYYIPKSLLVPVHTHEKELHTSLGIGGGFDGNISYAFTKHFAVFTTGTLGNLTAFRPGFILSSKRYIHKNDYALKGGFGYFTATKGKVFNCLETYIGIGNYKVDNYQYFEGDYQPDGRFGYATKARFQNVFWQFQATQKKPKHELALALRLAYAKYQYLEFQDRYGADIFNSQILQFPGVKGFTIEPAINYSYLVGKFKLNAQIGFSKSLNTSVINGREIAFEACVGRIAIQRNFDFRKKSEHK